MKKFTSLLLSLFLLTACSSTVAPTDSNEVQKVKIGVLGPLTGDAAVYGMDIQKVLNYELAGINKDAEKTGFEYELVFEDGRCSGVESVNAFQKITDIDGVDFVIGGVCSSETLAIAQIAQDKGVLLFSPVSSNPDLEKEGDYIFTLSYNDNLVGEGIANELNQFKKVAMISEQNDYNVGVKKVVTDNLLDSVELIADETFEKGGSDFRNSLEKIAKENPDAIFLNPNAGVVAKNLLKQFGEIPALADIQLVTQGTYLADIAREESGDTAEGMIIIDAPKLNSAPLQSAYNAIEAEKGEIEALGMYYTASTLDSLKLLTDMISVYGEDASAVKDALRRGSFTGYLGKIHFGEYNFVQNIPVGRYIVEDGEAVLQK